jgi:hypothetical protein
LHDRLLAHFPPLALVEIIGKPTHQQ